jgi:hypothetical protein
MAACHQSGNARMLASPAAWSPTTSTTATTPAGPEVPDFITTSERSRS